MPVDMLTFSDMKWLVPLAARLDRFRPWRNDAMLVAGRTGRVWIEAPQRKRWWRPDSSQRVAAIIRGVKFKDGEKQTERTA